MYSFPTQWSAAGSEKIHHSKNSLCSPLPLKFKRLSSVYHVNRGYWQSCAQPNYFSRRQSTMHCAATHASC